MKRKFSMFLNLAMLCLCVCAIAFGVYSAKTASLKVTGMIGFKAHNCDVDVTATIAGYAESPDGKPISTPKNLTLEAVTLRGQEEELELGKIYFSDLTNSGEINPITVELTFTNQSNFNVDVIIVPKTVTNLKISANYSRITLSDKDTTDGTKTKSIIITLTCTSTETIDSNVKQEFFSVDIVKNVQFQVEEANDFFWNNLSTNTRSYVTLGQADYDDKTPLRWYIFAKGATDGSNMQAVTSAVETNADKTLKAGTYWFISEKILEKKKFHNEYKVLDYETSLVKEYFEDEYGFVYTHNIASVDPVYSNIYARTLPGQDAYDAELWIPEFNEIGWQKFWLLSIDELEYLNNGNPVLDYDNHSTLIAKNLSNTSDIWTTRTPWLGDGEGYYWIDNLGGVRNSGSTDANYGILPAFQITIY